MDKYANAENRRLDVLMRMWRDDISPLEANARIELIHRTSPSYDGPEFRPGELASCLARIDEGLASGLIRTDAEGRPVVNSTRSFLGMGALRGRDACRVYWVDRMGLSLMNRPWSMHSDEAS